MVEVVLGLVMGEVSNLVVLEVKVLMALVEVLQRVIVVLLVSRELLLQALVEQKMVVKMVMMAVSALKQLVVLAVMELMAVWALEVPVVEVLAVLA